MSAPSSTPDQEALPPHPPPQDSAGHSSRRSLAVLAGTVVLLVSGLAVLAAGIAIGNALRKRVDRWRRGY